MASSAARCQPRQLFYKCRYSQSACSSGNSTYDTNKKLVKEKIYMADTILPSGPKKGEVQHLYFGKEHTLSGQFKGMVELLVECGWDRARFVPWIGIHSKCAKFKCINTSPTSQCCARQILFNEEEFVSVPSLLEDAMSLHGISVIFLLKFHCKLSPIEQCWGYAKHVYRLNPMSSK